MGQRFSRIRHAIKKLGATGPGITKYQEFRAGTAQYNVTSRPRGSSQKRSINPFGLGGAQRAKVFVSGRSVPPQFGLSPAELGWDDPNEDDMVPAGFRPAKIIVFDGTEGGSSPPSQITGIEYNKPTGQSYTYPFGLRAAEQTTGGQPAINAGEFEVFQDLVGKIETIVRPQIRRVSYKPERFGQR